MKTNYSLKTQRFLLKSLVVMILILGSQLAQAQLLVTNGDFETGDLTGWMNSGNITVVSSAVINGTNSLDYSGGDTVTNGVISQTISVSAGVPYQLNFNYGYLGINKNHQMDIQVDGAGGVGSLLNDSVNMTTPYTAPQLYSQIFTPDANSITLRFSDVAANDTVGSDMILDDVAIIQLMVASPPVVVPMVNQLTLIVLGFLLLLTSLYFYKKKSSYSA